MDNVIRRRSLALAESDETTAGVEEPPSPEGFGPLASEHVPEWVVRLTKLSRTAHAQTEFTIHRLHRWVDLNRELTLRLTAHGIILVAITATLSLSHVRLADLRLPSLATPQNSRVAPVWTASAPAASDSESFLQRPMVPRTASAVNIRMSANDANTLAPREDLFASPPRITETRVSVSPPSAVIDNPTEPMVDAPTPEIPTLDALIQSYVVENGDTLLGIAYKFEINLEALVAANPSLNGNLNTIFHPGDEFTIPPPGGMLHIVKEGDTLQSIGEKYEVEVKDIVSYGPNRLQADSQLAPNQLVFVPQGAYDLPLPTPQPAQPNTLAGVLQPRTTTATTTTTSARPATTTTTTTRAATNTTAARTAASTQPTVASGTLRTPLYGYVITQYFWAYHNGVDLAAPIGTPVYAADAGRVIYSGWDNTGYGYMVLIDHGNGYRTRYGHLSWIFPSYGTYMAKGEQIGKVGSTGRSSGPHLHFEVIINGIARNPFAYIR